MNLNIRVKKNFIVIVGLFISIFSHRILYGSGYDKSNLWSGEQTGKAGAVISSVSGADSLYYNPAGLVNTNGNHDDYSVNLAGLFPRSYGPVAVNNTPERGKRLVSFSGALLGRYKFNDSFALGLGVYAANGMASKFEHIDFSRTNSKFTYRPDIETNVDVVEASLGGAFKLSETISFGVAYRIGRLTSTIKSASTVPTLTPVTNQSLFAEINADDLKDTYLAGYRLGLQFEQKKWGIGISYRSKMTYQLEGKSSGKLILNAAPTLQTLAGGTINTTLEIPQQAAIGFHYAWTPDLKTFITYEWTNYDKIDRLTIYGPGSTMRSSSTATNIAIPPLILKWKDQHNIRIAFENKKEQWTVRGGFIATSRVTNKDHMRATFVSPGTSYTFILGAGKEFGGYQVDGAVEYAFVKGDAKTTPDAANQRLNGEFKTAGPSLHLSVKF